MMKFYAFRAFTIASDDVYESMWRSMLEPYRKMLGMNLTTWEEDDVRQRSDCHAWGSVPIYEFCTVLAGVRILEPGGTKILFTPRLGLSKGLKARVCVGRDNMADIEWETSEDGEVKVGLKLRNSVHVVSRLPGAGEVEHGVVGRVTLVYLTKALEFEG